MKPGLQKKTKIVATISDQRCDIDFLKALYETGMNVVRLNTAHMSMEGAKNIINNVRAVSKKIGILIDTKGPEIRLTAMENSSGFDISAGTIIKLSGDSKKLCTPTILYTNYSDIVHEVPVGAKIVVDDGEMAFTVVDKDKNFLFCRAENDGEMKGRKTVNVPEIPLNLKAVSDKDREFIRFAIDNDIDFIAHSFVRSKADILAVQEILKEHDSPIRIIAKIENKQGIENIDEILSCVHGVMVARGDLGVEIAAEKVPVVQQMLIEKCIEREKVCIIATQMLHSMIEHPRPTRAEVTDVANAISQHTDAIMLSGETATGKYPVEAVLTMTKIAMEMESRVKPIMDKKYKNPKVNDINHTLAKAAVQASIELDLKIIVTDTYNGRSVRHLASFRSAKRVFAFCYHERTMRQLALTYGVYCFPSDNFTNTEAFTRNALNFLRGKGIIESQDVVAVMSGNYNRRGPNALEIDKVEELVREKRNLYA